MCYNTRFTPESTSLVYDSYFTQISSPDKGGAVFIEDLTAFLNVSYSSFYNCSSSSSGGSIFSNTSSLYLYAVCCRESKSSKGGSFIYSYCANNKENTILYTSLSHCSCDKSYIAITVRGFEKCNFLNSTFNHCYQTSGFMFHYGNDRSNTSYGSLVNNSDIRGCTLEYSDGRMHIMNYNILYNIGTSSDSSPCGIMSTWRGIGSCELCTFLYNTGSKYLFFSDRGNLEIKNCLFDIQTKSGSNIVFTGTSEIYNVINMIHTGHCEAKGEPYISNNVSKFYVPGKAPTQLHRIEKTCSKRTDKATNMIFFVIYISS